MRDSYWRDALPPGPPYNEASLMVGQTGFTLACNVSGTHNLNNLMITYQWTRNYGTTQTQIGSNSNMFILPPLRLSSAILA